MMPLYSVFLNGLVSFVRMSSAPMWQIGRNIAVSVLKIIFEEFGVFSSAALARKLTVCKMKSMESCQIPTDG